jgi:hypothetical protein
VELKDVFQNVENILYAVFFASLNDSLITIGKSNILELYLVWNMVDGREKTDLYHAYDSAIAESGLQAMRTVIPDSKRFRREMSGTHRPVFHSTIFPVDRSPVKGSNVEKLVT